MAELSGPEKDKIMWIIIAVGIVLVVFSFGMTEGTFR